VILGFTGSSRIITGEQIDAVEQYMVLVQPDALTHGDCIIADAIAHKRFRRLFPGRMITVWPPVNPGLRAFCGADDPHCEIMTPRPYLERDQRIAQECDKLLAVPNAAGEVRRSGTWATVRYAISEGKPVTIIWPDGRTEENWAGSASRRKE
jgi:hypothetical protein